jgi:hypothetical protein
MNKAIIATTLLGLVSFLGYAEDVRMSRYLVLRAGVEAKFPWIVISAGLVSPRSASHNQAAAGLDVSWPSAS